MESIAISKFKATCLAVIERVQRTGEPVLITRRGVPMAELSRAQAVRSRRDWIGSWASRIKTHGDIVGPAAPVSDWDVLK